MIDRRPGAVDVLLRELCAPEPRATGLQYPQREAVQDWRWRQPHRQATAQRQVARPPGPAGPADCLAPGTVLQRLSTKVGLPASALLCCHISDCWAGLHHRGDLGRGCKWEQPLGNWCWEDGGVVYGSLGGREGHGVHDAYCL